jgi:HK97 family phage major capsid protein
MTKEERKQLETRAGELYKLALKESRKLSPAEETELRGIEAQIDSADYRAAHPEPSPAAQRFASGLEVRSREPRPGEVRTFKRGENFASIAPPYEGPGIGAYVRGLVTGNWTHAEELRQLSESSLGAGGYLVPTPLSLQVIELMRNQTQVINAGAISVPMSSSTLKMGRLASDVTSYWKAENAPATYSENTFEQILFTAHTVIAAVKLSEEILEDAYNIDAIVSDSLAKSLALEMDRAALYGTGLNDEPLGIKNYPGVTITDTSGSPSTPMVFQNYQPIGTGIAKLMSYNFKGPFGAMLSPETAGKLDNLQDSLGQPMRQPPLVEACEKYITNQIPSTVQFGSPAISTTDIFLGEWQRLMLGIRTSLVMEVSRVAGDSTGSAFSNLQAWLRIYARMDCQLSHPLAFNVLAGIGV